MVLSKVSRQGFQARFGRNGRKHFFEKGFIIIYKEVVKARLAYKVWKQSLNRRFGSRARKKGLEANNGSKIGKYWLKAII